MFVGILGMSSWLYVNTSRLSLKKLTISSLVFVLRLVPIWVVFVGSLSTSSIVSSFSTISGVLFLITHEWFSFEARTA